jgi:hypothetical protein
MAAPFAAGAAALALSALAARDYKYFHRGAEVRAFLGNASAASPRLAATGGSALWGSALTPNGVIDWAQACARVRDGAAAASTASTGGAPPVIAGTYVDANGDALAGKGAVELVSDFPRSAGAAHVAGASLALFQGGGSDALPDAYAAPAARPPDYERLLPSAISFGSAIGGARSAVLSCVRLLSDWRHLCVRCCDSLDNTSDCAGNKLTSHVQPTRALVPGC